MAKKTTRESGAARGPTMGKNSQGHIFTTFCCPSGVLSKYAPGSKAQQGLTDNYWFEVIIVIYNDGGFARRISL